MTLAIVLVIGLFALAVCVYSARQKSGRRALAWALATAAERGVPLPAAVRAVAGTFWGGLRRKARRLAQLLDDGTPLADGINEIPELFPDDLRLAVAMGSESGRLSETLREALDAQQRRQRTWRPILARLAYVLIVLLALQTAFVFMMYFVMPRLRQILQDFAISLPSTTTLVIDTFESVFIGPVALVLFYAAMFTALGALSTVGVPAGRLALLRRYLFRRDRATILRALAIEISARRALVPAVELLSALHPDGQVRQRLGRVHEALRAGADGWQTLCAAGFLKRGEMALLQAAERAGNLAWGLRAAAENLDRRLAHRLEMLAAILGPLAVILLGAVVAMFVIAYFLPLLKVLAQIGGGA